MIRVLELYQRDEAQRFEELARLERVLGILRRHLHVVQVIRLEFACKPSRDQWLAGHEQAARTRVRQQLRRIATFNGTRAPPAPTTAEWLWAARCDRDRFGWLVASPRLSADAKAWARGMLEIVEREIAALQRLPPVQLELFRDLPPARAPPRRRRRKT